MPANKSKAAKPAKIPGVPTRAGATTPAGDGPPDDDRRTPIPAPPRAATAPKAKKKTADEPPAKADTDPPATGSADTDRAEADPAGTDPAAVDVAPDEEAPPANPLEALRRAQAKRVAPPGTQPRFGGGGGRGSNPSAPRHYNRHK